MGIALSAFVPCAEVANLLASVKTVPKSIVPELVTVPFVSSFILTATEVTVPVFLVNPLSFSNSLTFVGTVIFAVTFPLWFAEKVLTVVPFFWIVSVPSCTVGIVGVPSIEEYGIFISSLPLAVFP